MDPLTLLREFVTSGHAEQVALTGDRVDFGGRYSFAKSIPTSYRSQAGKEDFYDLESLLFFVKHIIAGSTKFREYLKTARQANLMPVSFLDRKDLEEYLTGKKDKSDYIQLTIPDLQVDHLPSAKRARLDAAAGAEGEGGTGAGGAGGDATKDSTLKGILAQHELQLRDRNSMLSMPNRNLTKVLALLANVQKEEAKKAAVARPAKPVIPVKGSGRYERQTQQDARLRQLGADVLGTVQTGFVTASDRPAAPGSAGPSGAGAVPGAPPPPPTQPPPPPPAQQQPGSSSQRHHHRHPQQQLKPPAPPQHRSSGGSRSQPASGSHRPRSGTPIIMVPPALTSMVNMYNIQAFLEQGVFRTVEECKAESGGKKQDLIKISRTMGRSTPVAYHVTDKEPEKKEDWRRVVAVFCLGKAWQFKKWPFKGAPEGDLVETFSRVRGVFLHYNDVKVDPTVKGWNVAVMGLNREGRHRDVTLVQEFWGQLDAFLQVQKSTLLY